MTITTPGELAAALENLVRHVPGVATIYRSSSLLAGIVAATASALHLSSDDETLLLVDDDDEALTISVTIGTDAESATATCRAVHDTIVDYLSGIGRAPVTVKVTVGHVTE
jgi:hypothetical protein